MSKHLVSSLHHFGRFRYGLPQRPAHTNDLSLDRQNAGTDGQLGHGLPRKSAAQSLPYNRK